MAAGHNLGCPAAIACRVSCLRRCAPGGAGHAYSPALQWWSGYSRRLRHADGRQGVRPARGLLGTLVVLSWLSRLLLKVQTLFRICPVSKPLPLTPIVFLRARSARGGLLHVGVPGWWRACFGCPAFALVFYDEYYLLGDPNLVANLRVSSLRVTPILIPAPRG